MNAKLILVAMAFAFVCISAKPREPFHYKTKKTSTRSPSVPRATVLTIKVITAIHSGALEPSSGSSHVHRRGGRIATAVTVPLQTAAGRARNKKLHQQFTEVVKLLTCISLNEAK
ncbi:hypothetical protein ACROYT_G002874 [Oculina patagonica]